MMRSILVTAAAGFLAACTFNPQGHDDASWDVLDLGYFSFDSTSQLLAKADAGDAEAQLEAGDRYYWGNDVPQDFDTAESYWRLAADQGSEEATKRLHLVGSGEPIHYTPDGDTGRDFVIHFWDDTFDRI